MSDDGRHVDTEERVRIGRNDGGNRQQPFIRARRRGGLGDRSTVRLVHHDLFADGAGREDGPFGDHAGEGRTGDLERRVFQACQPQTERRRVTQVAAEGAPGRAPDAVVVEQRFASLECAWVDGLGIRFGNLEGGEYDPLGRVSLRPGREVPGETISASGSGRNASSGLLERSW